MMNTITFGKADFKFQDEEDFQHIRSKHEMKSIRKVIDSKLNRLESDRYDVSLSMDAETIPLGSNVWAHADYTIKQGPHDGEKGFVSLRQKTLGNAVFTAIMVLPLAVGSLFSPTAREALMMGFHHLKPESSKHFANRVIKEVKTEIEHSVEHGPVANRVIKE